jgi:site-specific recombinase XerD
MPMGLIEELDEFIIKERSKVTTGHGFIFIAQQKQNKGRPLTYRGIYEVFSTAVKKSGIVFRFHDARHSFITKLAESGMDISVLKIIAGHAHISTTQLYTHLSNKYLKQSLARYWQDNSLLGGDLNEQAT